MLFWNYHLGQNLNARVFFKSGTDEFQLLFKLRKYFIAWKIACIYICICIYACMYTLLCVLQYSLEDQQCQIWKIHLSHSF